MFYLYEVTYKKRKDSQKFGTKIVSFANSELDAIKQAKVKYPVCANVRWIEIDLEKAKELYCQDVKIMTNDVILMPSGNYGSHAPIEELFWRSLYAIVGYGITPEHIYANI